MEQTELWAGGLAAALLLLWMFRKRGAHLIKLILRTAAGGAFLAVIAPISGSLGIALGVNLFNALVLGVLGMPGFGLLLLLRWSFLKG